MRYVSTRGAAPDVDFRQALLDGLAPDGGLYVPAEIPWHGARFFRQRRSFAELAQAMLAPMVAPVLDGDALAQIAADAFDFPVPLVRLEERVSVLELFCGPTLAFKDFAARFLARAMERLADGPQTVLVATSGDTGGAVASGFAGLESVRVVILYPHGGVSALQERQLCGQADNIRALAVDGSFDDCQALVKRALGDAQLRARLAMSSANSINIARLLPQMVYYAFGWAQAGCLPGLACSVPSGNFGNLCAGVLARRMGLPIGPLVAATNINSAFPEYLDGGAMEARAVQPSLSNAMDVAAPGNLERIRHLYDDDLAAMRNEICACGFGDDQTEDCMRRAFHEHDYLLDPHSAVGLLGLYRCLGLGRAGSGMVLATAHPGKFADAVADICGAPVAVPPAIASLPQREAERMPCDYDALRAVLL